MIDIYIYELQYLPQIDIETSITDITIYKG